MYLRKQYFCNHKFIYVVVLDVIIYFQLSRRKWTNGPERAIWVPNEYSGDCKISIHVAKQQYNCQ